MRAAVVLVLALACFPVRAEEVEGSSFAGRITASARLGGGASSDLYLGAQLGSTGQLSASPTANLDLSFAPWLKLFTRTDLDYERYLSTGGSAWGLSGQAILQLRPSEWVYPELIASAQSTWFVDLLGPADPQAASSATATNSRGATVGAGVRAFAGRLCLRAYGLAGSRRSESTDVSGDVFSETPLSAVGSASLPLGSSARATALYRYTRNLSDVPGLDYDGNEALAKIAASFWRQGLVRGSVALRRNEFSTGRVDWLPRATLALSQGLWGPVSLEVSYSFEHDESSDATATGDLHAGYLGLRAEGGPWSF